MGKFIIEQTSFNSFHPTPTLENFIHFPGKNLTLTKQTLAEQGLDLDDVSKH